jgi:membrane protease YdiL (CAAX protease family)
LFRRFVDRRPWAGMALPSPWRRHRDLAAGFVLGAAMILIVFGIEYFLGWIRILGVKPGFAWDAVVGVLIGRFIHFIGTAVCEEIAYRSYLLQNVGERFRIWIAVLTTGAVFGASHCASAGFTWSFVVGAIVASFFLASMRLITRAIWLGVGWHLGWDWLEDGLGMIPGYSPLKTERLGPPLWVGMGLAIEGGLLIIFIMTAAFIGLLAYARLAHRGINWNATLNPDSSTSASEPIKTDRLLQTVAPD